MNPGIGSRVKYFSIASTPTRSTARAWRLVSCLEARSILLVIRLLSGLESSMPIEIGHVEAIFRYPVKSMSGERLEAAELGWHGIEGDRRLAFRRMTDHSGFP
jgi:MOSC N-terminal beta barrel domain